MAKKSPNNPQKFLDLWNDDSKWEHVHGVPVFDEHVEQYSVPGADGQPQSVSEQFDAARLQKIADNCNRMVQSGNPIGLTVGHTVDKGPETQQPETIGYSHNFRVDMHPTLQKPCIFHDEKFYPAKYELAKGLPYRSVERWRPNSENGGDYFRPIALLRREPRRNLGVVAYQVGTNTVIRYSMEQYAMPDEPKKEPDGDEGKSPATPAAEIPPAAPAAPPPAAPAPPAVAPTVPPSGPNPSEQDKQIFQYLCKMYGIQCGPEMAGGAAPPPVQNAGAAMPSGSNVTPPAMPQVKPMSADTNDVARYAAMESRIKELEKSERVARYHAKFEHMAEIDGFPIDPVEEVTRCQDYSQEQFDQHVRDIEKYAANSRLPVGPGVRPDGAPNPMKGKGDDQPWTRETYEKAMQYQREHPGASKAECIRYAKGETPVRS